MVGHFPAELLRGLERQRLRTLGVERAHVHVDERPRVRARELGAQAVDGVVVAVDGDHVAAVDRGGDDLALLEVRGDEHEAAQARVRRVRGDRVGQIAGARARGHLEPELERLRERDRGDAVLERVRGVHGVVLDPHLTEAELGREPVGTHERREPRAEVDRGVAVAGQEVGVAPHRQRPRRDLLAADVLGDRLVVVGHLERPEAPLAREDRRDLVLAPALPTSQTLYVSHRPSIPPQSALSHRHLPRRALERLERRTALWLTHRSGIGT